MRMLVLDEPTGTRYLDCSNDAANHVALLDVLAKRLERGWYDDSQDDKTAALEILNDSDYATAEDFLFARAELKANEKIRYAVVETSRAY